jgi:hypothetical protein
LVISGISALKVHPHTNLHTTAIVASTSAINMPKRKSATAAGTSADAFAITNGTGETASPQLRRGSRKRQSANDVNSTKAAVPETGNSAKRMKKTEPEKPVNAAAATQVKKAGVSKSDVKDRATKDTGNGQRQTKARIPPKKASKTEDDESENPGDESSDDTSESFEDKKPKTAKKKVLVGKSTPAKVKAAKSQVLASKESKGTKAKATRKSTDPSTDAEAREVSPDLDMDDIPDVNPTVPRHKEPTFWLMKSEPVGRIENGVEIKFSIDDLRARTEPEGWDGKLPPFIRHPY